MQVDRCRSQVGVPELPLDDVERDALAGELERVRMSQLVRRGLRLTSAFAGTPRERPHPGGKLALTID